MPARTAIVSRSAAIHEDESINDVTNTEFDNGSVEDKPSKPVINRTVVSKVAKKRAPRKSGIMKKAVPAKSKTQQRAPLKDRTNVQDGNETEEVEEFEGDDSVVAPTKPRAKKSRSANENINQADTPVAKKSKASKSAAPAERANKIAATRKPSAASKRAASPELRQTIPETQVDTSQDVSESIEMMGESMVVDEEPEPAVQRVPKREVSVSRQQQQHAIPARARSTSQQARHFSRGGSASEAERRVGDADSRRKLAEMTSKYEDMRLKYETLQELGHNGAESNFERLKRATDQKAKDASELISSLKKELSDLRRGNSTSTADNARLQSQMTNLQSESEKSQAETKTLQSSLSESQNEIKALTAKLEAARKAVTTAGEKVTSSTTQMRDVHNRSQLGGVLDSTKQAALKEQLYSDLTGLIITSIKRKDGEDEYSCVQTGRNGTLHFHLAINTDPSVVNPRTPSGSKYEDTEFAYEPFFDEGRDRDLIDILPDYLTEEICFPRDHAMKFYSKVVDSMTRKVEMEDE